LIAGTLVAFGLLELALCAVPGPAVLITVATTLRRGRSHGLAALAGVVAGNTLYFVLSGAGVVALLLASYRAFAIVKLAGASYLAYLGLRGLLARDAPRSAVDVEVEPSAGDRGGSFVRGAVVQLANPKAIVFFVAVVPQFVDPRGNVPERIAFLALISVAAESFVLTAYVALADRVRRSERAARTLVWIERVGGGILLAIAAGFAREPFGNLAP
jgi:homoserine/homoserine lactone efflux protein